MAKTPWRNEDQAGTEYTANRHFKDTVFRLLFREKSELLSLFNAVNGTNYENSEELEVNTLENAIYMSMKNDLSCVLDNQVNLFEHQSTPNPNMPLRDLFYTARLYEKMIRASNNNVYSQKMIRLPQPKFIIFYNGEVVQPEKKLLYLSDLYAKTTGNPDLELKVIQLNINPGYNEDLKKNCESLRGYMIYVDKVRNYNKFMPLEQAVEQAVRECIQDGILADFFQRNQTEVIQMSIFEYDQEAHMQQIREEGREEGFEEGREEGFDEGFEEGTISCILTLLEPLGEVPESLKKRLSSADGDANTLTSWLRLAAKVASIDEFEKKM